MLYLGLRDGDWATDLWEIFYDHAVFVWAFENGQGGFSQIAFWEDTCVHAAGSKILQPSFLEILIYHLLKVSANAVLLMLLLLEERGEIDPIHKGENILRR